MKHDRTAATVAVSETAGENGTAVMSGTTVMPPHEIEAAIASIWAEILGLDQVGLHDNFLLLGGESLLATQVVSQIRSRLGCQVSIRSIFVGTVAEVAAEVGKMLSGAAGDAKTPDPVAVSQQACVARP